MSEKSKLRQWAVEQAIRVFEIGGWPPVYETTPTLLGPGVTAPPKELVMSSEERWEAIYATAFRIEKYVND